MSIGLSTAFEYTAVKSDCSAGGQDMPGYAVRCGHVVLGGGFAGGRCLQFVALEHIIGLHSQPAAQKLRNIKVILFAGIQQVLVLRMLGNIEFIEKKGLTPCTCKIHLPPSITASSSVDIKSFPNF